MVKSQISTGLLLIILAVLTAAASSPLAQEKYFYSLSSVQEKIFAFRPAADPSSIQSDIL